MYFIDFPNEIVSSVCEVEIDSLKCHEQVVDNRLNSLIDYIKSLEGDLLISSIIVCNKTFMIIDGHHRYHALNYFGVKKVPVTFINYKAPEIKAYYDDRVTKSEILAILETNKLLPPKSTKHVIFDNKSKEYKPILLISSLWYLSINK